MAKPTAKDTADWTETPADRERALVVASKNRGVPMSLAEVAAQAQARGRAAISSGTSAPVAERKGPAPKTLVEVRTPTPDPPPSPLARCAPRRSPSPQTPLLQLSCPPSRQVHQELAEKKKKETKGKAEWEGKHPWKVRSRSTNPNPNPTLTVTGTVTLTLTVTLTTNPDPNPNPWKPWDREKDLEVRLGKSQKDVLNDKVMGKISDRFGGGKRETSFI